MIITLATIVALTILLSGAKVCAQTLSLTPNPATQGEQVQVTGSGFQQDENAQISLYSYTAGACGSIPVMNINVNTDSDGNLQPITIDTSTLSAGTYCVEGNGFLDPPDTVNLVVNPAVAGAITGQASSTPVYLYCLPLSLVAIGVIYIRATRKHREET